MKHLSEALNKAIEELAGRDNQATVDRAFDTLNKMIEALTPAARQEISPFKRRRNEMKNYIEKACEHNRIAELMRSDFQHALAFALSANYENVVCDFNCRGEIDVWMAKRYGINLFIDSYCFGDEEVEFTIGSDGDDSPHPRNFKLSDLGHINEDHKFAVYITKKVEEVIDGLEEKE